jgi:hypothetical protein
MPPDSGVRIQTTFFCFWCNYGNTNIFFLFSHDAYVVRNAFVRCSNKVHHDAPEQHGENDEYEELDLYEISDDDDDDDDDHDEAEELEELEMMVDEAEGGEVPMRKANLQRDDDWMDANHPLVPQLSEENRLDKLESWKTSFEDKFDFLGQLLLEQQREGAALRARIQELELISQQRGEELIRLNYELHVMRQEAASNAKQRMEVKPDPLKNEESDGELFTL